MKDLTGQHFGYLTVLRRDETKIGGAAYWICQCKCGNIKSVRSDGLTNKKTPTRSCGCLRKEIIKQNIDTESLIGKTFGKLLVIERDLNRPVGHGKEAFWQCECQCGNIISVSTSSLQSGRTSSCGCYRKEYRAKQNAIDLTGQTFGLLTAIKRLPITNKKLGYLWECQCNCGEICEIATYDLTSGKKISCFKHNLSRGETLIMDILNKNNIDFIYQYSYADLISDKSGILRYDFAILNNDKQVIRLIEFDGEQHTNPNSFYYSEQTVKNDKLKNEYAQKHNIPLIRIPYSELKNLNIDILFSNQYLI